MSVNNDYWGALPQLQWTDNTTTDGRIGRAIQGAPGFNGLRRDDSDLSRMWRLAQQEQLDAGHYYWSTTGNERNDGMQLLETAKAGSLAGATVEQLVFLWGLVDDIGSSYAVLGVLRPKWIDERLAAIKDTIHAKVKEEAREQLAAKKKALDALKSKEAKRQELEAEIAELEGSLKG